MSFSTALRREATGSAVSSSAAAASPSSSTPQRLDMPTAMAIAASTQTRTLLPHLCTALLPFLDRSTSQLRWNGSKITEQAFLSRLSPALSATLSERRGGGGAHHHPRLTTLGPVPAMLEQESVTHAARHFAGHVAAEAAAAMAPPLDRTGETKANAPFNHSSQRPSRVTIDSYDARASSSSAAGAPTVPPTIAWANPSAVLHHAEAVAAVLLQCALRHAREARMRKLEETGGDVEDGGGDVDGERLEGDGDDVDGEDENDDSGDSSGKASPSQRSSSSRFISGSPLRARLMQLQRGESTRSVASEGSASGRRSVRRRVRHGASLGMRTFPLSWDAFCAFMVDEAISGGSSHQEEGGSGGATTAASSAMSMESRFYVLHHTTKFSVACRFATLVSAGRMLIVQQNNPASLPEAIIVDLPDCTVSSRAFWPYMVKAVVTLGGGGSSPCYCCLAELSVFFVEKRLCCDVVGQLSIDDLGDAPSSAMWWEAQSALFVGGLTGRLWIVQPPTWVQRTGQWRGPKIVKATTVISDALQAAEPIVAMGIGTIPGVALLLTSKCHVAVYHHVQGVVLSVLSGAHYGMSLSSSLRVSHASDFAVVGGEATFLLAWQPRNSPNQQPTILDDPGFPHACHVIGLVIDAIAPVIASIDGHGILKLWNFDTLQPTQTLRVTLSAETDFVAMFFDGQLLVIVLQRQLILYKIDDDYRECPVRGLTVHPRGGIVTGAVARDIVEFNSRNGRRLVHHRNVLPRGEIMALAYSTDASILYVLSNQGELSAHSSATTKRLCAWDKRTLESEPLGMTFCKVTHRLVVITVDHLVWVLPSSAIRVVGGTSDGGGGVSKAAAIVAEDGTSSSPRSSSRKPPLPTFVGLKLVRGGGHDNAAAADEGSNTNLPDERVTSQAPIKVALTGGRSASCACVAVGKIDSGQITYFVGTSDNRLHFLVNKSRHVVADVLTLDMPSCSPSMAVSQLPQTLAVGRGGGRGDPRTTPPPAAAATGRDTTRAADNDTATPVTAESPSAAGGSVGRGEHIVALCYSDHSLIACDSGGTIAVFLLRTLKVVFVARWADMVSRHHFQASSMSFRSSGGMPPPPPFGPTAAGDSHGGHRTPNSQPSPAAFPSLSLGSHSSMKKAALMLDAPVGGGGGGWLQLPGIVQQASFVLREQQQQHYNGTSTASPSPKAIAAAAAQLTIDAGHTQSANASPQASHLLPLGPPLSGGGTVVAGGMMMMHPATPMSIMTPDIPPSPFRGMYDPSAALLANMASHEADLYISHAITFIAGHCFLVADNMGCISVVQCLRKQPLRILCRFPTTNTRGGHDMGYDMMGQQTNAASFDDGPTATAGAGVLGRMHSVRSTATSSAHGASANPLAGLAVDDNDVVFASALNNDHTLAAWSLDGEKLGELWGKDSNAHNAISLAKLAPRQGGSPVTNTPGQPTTMFCPKTPKWLEQFDAAEASKAIPPALIVGSHTSQLTSPTAAASEGAAAKPTLSLLPATRGSSSRRRQQQSSYVSLGAAGSDAATTMTTSNARSLLLAPQATTMSTVRNRGDHLSQQHIRQRAADIGVATAEVSHHHQLPEDGHDGDDGGGDGGGGGGGEEAAGYQREKTVDHEANTAATQHLVVAVVPSDARALSLAPVMLDPTAQGSVPALVKQAGMSGNDECDTALIVQHQRHTPRGIDAPTRTAEGPSLPGGSLSPPPTIGNNNRNTSVSPAIESPKAAAGEGLRAIDRRSLRRGSHLSGTMGPSVLPAYHWRRSEVPDDFAPLVVGGAVKKDAQTPPPPSSSAHVSVPASVGSRPPPTQPCISHCMGLPTVLGPLWPPGGARGGVGGTSSSSMPNATVHATNPSTTQLLADERERLSRRRTSSTPEVVNTGTDQRCRRGGKDAHDDGGGDDDDGDGDDDGSSAFVSWSVTPSSSSASAAKKTDGAKRGLSSFPMTVAAALPSETEGGMPRALRRVHVKLASVHPTCKYVRDTPNKGK